MDLGTFCSKTGVRLTITPDNTLDAESAMDDWNSCCSSEQWRLEHIHDLEESWLLHLEAYRCIPLESGAGRRRSMCLDSMSCSSSHLWRRSLEEWCDWRLCPMIGELRPLWRPQLHSARLEHLYHGVLGKSSAQSMTVGTPCSLKVCCLGAINCLAYWESNRDSEVPTVKLLLQQIVFHVSIWAKVTIRLVSLHIKTKLEIINYVIL